MKIEELQRKLEESLHDVLERVTPAGLRPVVRLLGPANGQKVESAPAETWSPEAGDTILICFQPDPITRARDYGDSPRARFSREDFDPVEISGEPLSATVMRDRR